MRSMKPAMIAVIALLLMPGAVFGAKKWEKIKSPPLRDITVPTVERGLCEVAFWSMETAGESPSIVSTSGLFICPRNCLA